MDIIRGTTPTITFKVKNNVDLTNVTQVWVYLTQQNKPKVFKDISSVTVDAQTKTITTHLSQSDTLELRAGVDCYFQIRVLFSDGQAPASKMKKITILPVGKDGEIKNGNTV